MPKHESLQLNSVSQCAEIGASVRGPDPGLIPGLGSRPGTHAECPGPGNAPFRAPEWFAVCSGPVSGPRNVFRGPVLGTARHALQCIGRGSGRKNSTLQKPQLWPERHWCAWRSSIQGLEYTFQHPETSSTYMYTAHTCRSRFSEPSTHRRCKSCHLRSARVPQGGHAITSSLQIRAERADYARVKPLSMHAP